MRTRDSLSKDYFNHRQSVNTERKFDEEYLQNPGRFSYSYQNEGMEGQAGLKTGRMLQEGATFLTERTKDIKNPPKEE